MQQLSLRIPVTNAFMPEAETDQICQKGGAGQTDALGVILTFWYMSDRVVNNVTNQRGYSMITCSNA